MSAQSALFRLGGQRWLRAEQLPGGGIDLAEKRDDVQDERLARPLRVPDQLVSQDLRPLVVGMPAFEGLRRVIDDPVLGDPVALIARALGDAVVPRRAR